MAVIKYVLTLMGHFIAPVTLDIDLTLTTKHVMVRVITNERYFIVFVDINECVELSSGCDHNCTNTIGSFSCSCKDGYALYDDKQSCIGKIRFL